MLPLLAHASQYHTTDTPSWQHILTQPFVMNILFVIGAAVIGWLLQERLFASQMARSGVLGVYCLIVAIISLNYDKPLSVVAWSLAFVCLIVVLVIKLTGPIKPTVKGTPKKK